MTTTQTTMTGARVNPYSGLCPKCAECAAQDAVYWTNDANFSELDAKAWPVAARFSKLQQTLTDARRWCREECGRVNA